MNLLDLIPGALASVFMFGALFIPIVGYIFREWKLNLIELGLLSVAFSILGMPVLVWLLNFIFPYSSLLVIGAFTLPLVASIYLIASGRFMLEPHHTALTKSSLIILLIVLTGFVLRLQSLSAFFYEFDPYWYGMTPEYLITQGHVPLSDDLAYALSPVGHRALPVPQYLTAMWYSLSFGDGNYDYLKNAVVMNIYPPLIGALLAFLTYLLLKREYSSWIAIGAAFVVAFTPILFSKFLAGVAEQLPWGIYAALAGVVFIYFAVREPGNKLLYIPAAVAVLGAFLGSKAGMMPIVIGAAYVCAVAAWDFIRENRSTHAHWLMLSLAALTWLFSAIFSLYTAGTISVLPPTETLVLLFAAAFAFLITKLPDFRASLAHSQRERIYALLALGLLSTIFLITPLGQPLLNYGVGLAGVGQLMSEESAASALMKTVAEESLHGDDLQSRFGYMGVSLDISRITSHFITKYGSLNALPLIYVALALAAVYALVWRKSSLALLMLIFTLSISFIGLQKVKYTPHLGLVLALSFAVVAAEAYKASEDKGWGRYIGFYGAGLILMILCAYAALSYLYGGIMHFISGANVPMLALSGAYVAAFVVVLCALIYEAYNGFRAGHWDRTLSLMLVVLVLPYAFNNVETIPLAVEHATLDLTNHTAVTEFCGKARNSTTYSAALYCNIIPSYWYEPMLWMKDNIKDGSYVISWWDYGHWTNYFGRQKTITRNDHPFVELDLEVADKFVAGDERDLYTYMQSRNSTYALFDVDLIGKWGALTYLSCVYNNETSAKDLPSESQCSASYQFERIYTPQNPTISQMCEVGDSYGAVAGSSFSRQYCILKSGGMAVVFDYSTGKQVNALPVRTGSYRAQDGRVYDEYLMVYAENALDEAPGRGYKSNFYKAFFLGKLDGFEQVYPEEGGLGILPVRIYKKV
ncbi:MAG: hypothetical protein N3H30_02025 [Candidatus Micrarchaeota archaeon]|nr:hypothetical protein [Candidatus Micrarchaeota archaeon]